jgi:hypothetical protein
MRCYDLIVEGNDLVRLSSRSVKRFPIDLLGNGRFRMNARSNRTYCDIASSPPPPIVIPIVSEQIVTDTQNQGAPLAPFVLPNPVKAGSLLVFTYNSWRAGGASGNITSITDTQGNIWQKAVSCEQFPQIAGGVITSHIWYAQNCNAGATTVTPVGDDSDLYWSAGIQEVSGIAPSGSLDTTGFNNQQSVPATTVADDVSSQNRTLVIGLCCQDGFGDDPWTLPADYSQVYNVPTGSTDEPGFSIYKIATVAVMESINWIRNVVLSSSSSCIAVFKGITP